eukprot:1540824-Rhodomonas_salina.1
MSTQRVDNSSSSSVKLLGYGLDSWVPPTWSALAVPYFYSRTAIKYGSSSVKDLSSKYTLSAKGKLK